MAVNLLVKSFCQLASQKVFDVIYCASSVIRDSNCDNIDDEWLMITIVKVNFGTFYSVTDSWPEALCHLVGGSWLACANDIVVHYAAIHCPHQQTIGPTVCGQQTYTTPISYT